MFPLLLLLKIEVSNIIFKIYEFRSKIPVLSEQFPHFLNTGNTNIKVP